MSDLRRRLRLGYRFVAPLMNFRELHRVPRRYLSYVGAMSEYSRLPGAETLAFTDCYPCLHDDTGSNPFDPHYFYQDTWAFREVLKLAPKKHVDVGSAAMFVGMLSAVVDVTFVDIRPLRVELDRYAYIPGSVLELPFPDGSVESLSCLHVAEHIGLGRYGDPLDAQGTRKAAAELARVLAPGGQLLFSVPIGRPRVEFNAHRIHSSAQILAYFAGLRLRAYAGVDDRGSFLVSRRIDELDGCEYGCGFFVFEKKPG